MCIDARTHTAERTVLSWSKGEVQHLSSFFECPEVRRARRPDNRCFDADTLACQMSGANS